MPNIPSMLHQFEPRWVGDYDYINNCKWARRLIYWRPEVIVDLGHEPFGRPRDRDHRGKRPIGVRAI